MIFIGLFEKIFNKNKSKTPKNNLSLVSFSSGSYKNELSSVKPYENRLVRRIVNKIADLVASTPLKYYKEDVNHKVIEEKSGVAYLLNYAPNNQITGFNLKKQLVARALLNNNSYCWIRKNSLGEIIELVPIIESGSASLLIPKEKPDELYLKIPLQDGNFKVLPYDEIIHFRYDFVESEFFGDSNAPVKEIVSINDSLWDNLVSWARNNSFIRGFLKTTAVLSEEDEESAKTKFAQMMKSGNSSGFEILNGSFEYLPINASSQSLDINGIANIDEKAYDYYGISKKILQSNATPEEWESFHKGTLKPLYQMIEGELNKKLLTEKEIKGFGHRFVFLCDNFDHMSASEKTSSFTMLTNLGVVTVNEVRSAYGFSLVEGELGNSFMYSKNFAKVGETDDTKVKDKEDDNSVNNKDIEEEELDNG